MLPSVGIWFPFGFVALIMHLFLLFSVAELGSLVEVSPWDCGKTHRRWGNLLCVDLLPVNMPDIIQISSEAFARIEPDDSCTAHWLASRPDLFSQNPKQPEPNRIRASFAQHDPGHLWKNATESESGKVVAGQLRSAGTGPNDSCTLACFRTKCVRPKPDQAVHMGCRQSHKLLRTGVRFVRWRTISRLCFVLFLLW